MADGALEKSLTVRPLLAIEATGEEKPSAAGCDRGPCQLHSITAPGDDSGSALLLRAFAGRIAIGGLRNSGDRFFRRLGVSFLADKLQMLDFALFVLVTVHDNCVGPLEGAAQQLFGQRILDEVLAGHPVQRQAKFSMARRKGRAP